MISKFIEPWILVPGIFILLILVPGVLLLRTGRRIGTFAGNSPMTSPVIAQRKRIVRVGWTLIFAAAALYLLSIPLVSNTIRFALERSTAPAAIAALASADAVVVLGGGVYGDTPSERLLRRISGDDADHAASLAPEAESRLLYGYRLATALDLPVVVTGGRVFPDPSLPPEATVAGDLLVSLGFPPERIRREGDSRTTLENARYTAARFPFRKVIVVTSAYHMRRALHAFHAAGLEPLPAPAPYQSDRSAFQTVDLMPSHHALYLSAGTIREIIGLWYYRLVTATGDS